VNGPAYLVAMDDQISIGHLRFGEALFVSNVFKVLAALSIVGTGVGLTRFDGQVG